MREDIQVNQFLLASRSLFNSYFKVEQPQIDSRRAWQLWELFNPVEVALFHALVHRPLELVGPDYGSGPQPIRVCGNTGGVLPIMINREIDSGYWDYPLTNFSGDSDLRFIRFFDWSGIDRQDNRYVMVKIENWPQHPEVVGKRALIESHYCTYTDVQELPNPVQKP